MKNVILAKTGEIALKGLNKRMFEEVLVKNIKYTIKKHGSFEINKAQSIIYIYPKSENIDMEEVLGDVACVFGISAVNLAFCCEKELLKIEETIKQCFKEEFENAKTFKIEAKRSDKNFFMISPEIQQYFGDFVLKTFEHLEVDVKSPEIKLVIEVREKMAYIHGTTLKAVGGMPVGTSGKAGLLLSGGIDSPVAGFMMAKRGLSVLNIHFESPPYTSKRARDKVLTLAEKISKYTGNSHCVIINLAKIQEEIKEKCKDGLFTIIMRRYMMKICNRLAKTHNLDVLVTGESLAQVASQTTAAINCTDKSSDLPVFRPLIGLDKIEIIEISRKIDTFETSILPYEDCCTVFTPKHPITKPNLQNVLDEELKLDEERLIEQALENIIYI
ncbi:MAG: tRNA uracil 4-sulfurtransferase ThiI [Oscillospiraceae bacterium]